MLNWIYKEFWFHLFKIEARPHSGKVYENMRAYPWTSIPLKNSQGIASRISCSDPMDLTRDGSWCWAVNKPAIRNPLLVGKGEGKLDPLEALNIWTCTHPSLSYILIKLSFGLSIGPDMYFTFSQFFIGIMQYRLKSK